MKNNIQGGEFLIKDQEALDYNESTPIDFTLIRRPIVE